jgi:hypothetical protein
MHMHFVTSTAPDCIRIRDGEGPRSDLGDVNKKYFLSVPLVAHNSTDLYPAVWSMLTELFELHPACRHETCPVTIIHIKARLHGSPRLIITVESTKVNRVNSSFQRKWSTGLTGEQVGDGQLSFNIDDSLWVTHHILRVSTRKSRRVPRCRTCCSSVCLVLLIWLLNFVNYLLIMVFK